MKFDNSFVEMLYKTLQSPQVRIDEEVKENERMAKYVEETFPNAAFCPISFPEIGSVGDEFKLRGMTYDTVFVSSQDVKVIGSDSELVGYGFTTKFGPTPTKEMTSVPSLEAYFVLVDSTKTQGRLERMLDGKRHYAIPKKDFKSITREDWEQRYADGILYCKADEVQSKYPRLWIR